MTHPFPVSIVGVSNQLNISVGHVKDGKLRELFSQGPSDHTISSFLEMHRETLSRVHVSAACFLPSTKTSPETIVIADNLHSKFVVLRVTSLKSYEIDYPFGETTVVEMVRNHRNHTYLCVRFDDRSIVIYNIKKRQEDLEIYKCNEFLERKYVNSNIKIIPVLEHYFVVMCDGICHLFELFTSSYRTIRDDYKYLQDTQLIERIEGQILTSPFVSALVILKSDGTLAKYDFVAKRFRSQESINQVSTHFENCAQYGPHVDLSTIVTDLSQFQLVAHSRFHDIYYIYYGVLYMSGSGEFQKKLQSDVLSIDSDDYGLVIRTTDDKCVHIPFSAELRQNYHQGISGSKFIGRKEIDM